MTGGAQALQHDVARIALSVARAHGFALGGGHALNLYGIVHRGTEDVDLFTDVDGGVRAAGALVAAALADAGLHVTTYGDDLGEVFDGLDDELVEFEVTRGAAVMRLTLARFDRERGPVVMDIGPVLHLDDVLGGKVAALAARAEPRDFVDVAGAQRRYDRAQLMALGVRADPTLAADDFAAAMRRLDRLDDSVWQHLYGLSPQACAAVRAAFADWPR
ncbi:nucleotidyl transferase AbiEii/AbiGii toxin family protein [Catellatospora sp. KI3]|uniref:nucleotidyl transferase AbiEii/AbiGii toxin family protein n=1 Tax=Catellatospora sp. KI3 TaxID=3041620 RepID=UPI002482B6D5|nr:nucleotidyl transferase AbiEii/AbiGii toxin family protein [Catellatospora sp. KI3]MDI1463633.1 nucleotidyl transferase AbiEii/AbiGii toxin family protein [Catellatospora sp. KI3]